MYWVQNGQIRFTSTINDRWGALQRSRFTFTIVIITVAPQRLNIYSLAEVFHNTAIYLELYLLETDFIASSASSGKGFLKLKLTYYQFIETRRPNY